MEFDPQKLNIRINVVRDYGGNSLQVELSYDNVKIASDSASLGELSKALEHNSYY